MKPRKQMRIAMVVPSLKFVGPIIVVYGIVKELCQSFDFTIVSLRKNTSTDRKRFADLGARVSELNMGKFPARHFAKQLASYLTSEEFDLVHAHSYWPTILCCHYHGLKIVTVHNNPYEDFVYEYGNIIGRKMAKNFLRAIKYYDKVIGISEYVSKVCDCGKNITIYNAYIERDDQPANQKETDAVDLRDNRLNLYSISNINQCKNVRRIVDVIERYYQQFGDDIQCNIVGDGPERKRLEKIVREKGLESQIRFLGYQEAYFNKKLAKKSDAFIFTSLSEGFGLVLVEAMHEGKAIVASSLPATREILGDSQTNNYICETDADFVDALRSLYLLKHQVRKPLFFPENRVRCNTNFSQGRAGNDYAALYESLQRSHRKPKILYYIPYYSYGGIESLVETFIERNRQFEFSILIAHDLPEGIRNKLESMSVNIIKLPKRKRTAILSRKRDLEAVFRHNSFDVFHSHDLVDFLGMYTAKKYGIQKRILHIHSSSIEGKKVFYHFKKIIIRANRLMAAKTFACSQIAKASFGDSRTEVLYNGIVPSTFRFSVKSRKKVRKQLKINDTEKLIIQVGRLEKVKNYQFTLRLLSNLPPEIKLLIVGSGSLSGEIHRAITDLHLEQRVILIEGTDRVYDYLCAADLFLLPSFFEGLPNSLLEAEASGVQCLVSDKVTDEIDSLGLIQRAPLQESLWRDAILRTSPSNVKKRPDYNDLFAKTYFNFSHFEERLAKEYTADSRPDLSVIIPVYNGAEYIKKNIQHLKKTLRCNYEVVLIDDGSTDGTSQIVRGLAAKDSRIVAISKCCNEGVSSARNTGINVARGRYILFLDADDRGLSQIDNALYYAIEHNCDILKCDYLAQRRIKFLKTHIKTIDERGSGIVTKSDIRNLFIQGNALNTSWAQLVRREILGASQRFNPNYALAEDLDFNLNVYDAAQSVHYYGKPILLYCYNNHSASNNCTTIAKAKIFIDNIVEVYGKIFICMKKWGKYDKHNADILRHRTNQAVSYVIKTCPNAYREELEEYYERLRYKEDM